MKRVLFAILIVAMAAGSAWAFSAGDAGNYQEQVQDLSGQDYGINGGVSKYSGEQLGYGASASNGGFGIEYQGQIQGAHVNVLNSTGTVRHQYDIDTATSGSSVATGVSAAGHMEGTSTQAGIVTVSDGVGTGMASGTGISSDSGVLVGASVGAAAGAETAVNARTEYESVNNGATSAQYSTGMAEVKTQTGAGASGGIAGAGATATTVGGVGMVNDGMGSAMASTSASHSEVDTAAGAVGNAGAHASAAAMNAQQGYQAAVGFGTYQYQETYVATGAAE